jgi:glyoxylase-like metal-dependent hydrolase (beta-lactamase superfamily II)
VLIDTQFLPSDATKFADLAEKTTGKKAKLAIVLHPNPDKFNGAATLQARGIRVITSKQVADLIPAVHEIRTGWFAKDYAPEYPKDAPKLEVFGSETTQLQAAGIQLNLHVLGVGASGAHVVAQVDDALFVGDLIASGGHAWLELARFDEWAKRMDELAALKVQRVYVGRGEPGSAQLIRGQKRYLQTVREIVAAEKPAGELGLFKRWQLKRKIVAAFPGYGWDGFVWESLPAIWAALGK